MELILVKRETLFLFLNKIKNEFKNNNLLFINITEESFTIIQVQNNIRKKIFDLLDAKNLELKQKFLYKNTINRTNDNFGDINISINELPEDNYYGITTKDEIFQDLYDLKRNIKIDIKNIYYLSKLKNNKIIINDYIKYIKFINKKYKNNYIKLKNYIEKVKFNVSALINKIVEKIKINDANLIKFKTDFRVVKDNTNTDIYYLSIDIKQANVTTFFDYLQENKDLIDKLFPNDIEIKNVLISNDYKKIISYYNTKNISCIENSKIFRQKIFGSASKKLQKLQNLWIKNVDKKIISSSIISKYVRDDEIVFKLANDNELYHNINLIKDVCEELYPNKFKIQLFKLKSYLLKINKDLTITFYKQDYYDINDKNKYCGYTLHTFEKQYIIEVIKYIDKLENKSNKLFLFFDYFIFIIYFYITYFIDYFIN